MLFYGFQAALFPFGYWSFARFMRRNCILPVCDVLSHFVECIFCWIRVFLCEFPVGELINLSSLCVKLLCLFERSISLHWSHKYIHLYFLIKDFTFPHTDFFKISLFVTVLGAHCCTLSLAAALSLQSEGFSPWRLLPLQTAASGQAAQSWQLTGSKALAQSLWSMSLRPQDMWDLPGPGIEPVSPGLAAGFLTPGPLGKPSHVDF